MGFPTIWIWHDVMSSMWRSAHAGVLSYHSKQCFWPGNWLTSVHNSKRETRTKGSYSNTSNKRGQLRGFTYGWNVVPANIQQPEGESERGRGVDKMDIYIDRKRTEKATSYAGGFFVKNFCSHVTIFSPRFGLRFNWYYFAWKYYFRADLLSI